MKQPSALAEYNKRRHKGVLAQRKRKAKLKRLGIRWASSRKSDCPRNSAETLTKMAVGKYPYKRETSTCPNAESPGREPPSGAVPSTSQKLCTANGAHRGTTVSEGGHRAQSSQ
jgi:hypothetical protein